MLRTLSGLTGTINAATDGTIGSVNDFLFDDRSFAIRWLVVDTGGWLSGRKVLVHPSAIGAVDDRHGELRVSLSKERIEAGPSILSDQPVSEQYQQDLYGYHGWNPLWVGAGMSGGAMGCPMVGTSYLTDTRLRERAEAALRVYDQDPNLRSVAGVSGYHVHASDGDIGHVEGFVAE